MSAVEVNEVRVARDSGEEARMVAAIVVEGYAPRAPRGARYLQRALFSYTGAL